MASIPWIEKYRPVQFDQIVLEPTNKRLFQHMLNANYFPNLLFQGQCGTGKTTTIVNLITAYQRKHGAVNKSNIIHLNASDERGIDTVRTQINQFVKSSNLFNTGLKFVILDEVDYMTKTAQHALKYLLQSASVNVRFCLICNYITKIDESLKNELMCIRFNQLPKQDIRAFLKHMLVCENVHILDETIDIILNIHGSDIRSMINFIQLNQNLDELAQLTTIICDAVFQQIHELLTNLGGSSDIPKFIQNVSVQYNIDVISVLIKYFNYVIHCYPQHNVSAFFDIIQTILHNNSSPTKVTLDYFVLFLSEFYSADA